MSAERPTNSMPFEWIGRSQPRNTGYWLSGTPAGIPAHSYGAYLDDLAGGMDPELVAKWLNLNQPGGAWPNTPSPQAPPDQPPENALAMGAQPSLQWLTNALRVP